MTSCSSTSTRSPMLTKRRFRAKFASWAQTRAYYAIRVSDAATEFDVVVASIADCSGSEG